MGRSKAKGKRKPKRGHAKGANKDKAKSSNDEMASGSSRPYPRPKPSMTREERIQNRKAKMKTASKYSIDQLLDKVEECMDSFNYELAHSFCKRALELEPDNVSVLETLGNLLVEQGDAEGAKKCFGRAVNVCPDEGFSKYMYLGQLFEGKQAVECFQKGIEIMTRKLQESQSQGASAAAETEAVVSASDISSAYCSMAEIYLTDACFEAGADAQCKEYLDKALEYSPNSAEAFQLLASYWLSKENKEQAKEAIQQSLSQWLPAVQDAEEEEEEEEEEEDDERTDPISPCPVSYQSRICTAKILLELEELDTAEDILESLLEEDDEVVQVWYMMGLVNVYRKTEECKPPARFYLGSCKRLYSKMECDDAPVLDHIKELLNELGPGEGDDEEWLLRQAVEMDEDDESRNGQDKDNEDENICSSGDEEDMEH